jgi:hypothetical protein
VEDSRPEVILRFFHGYRFFLRFLSRFFEGLVTFSHLRQFSSCQEVSVLSVLKSHVRLELILPELTIIVLDGMDHVFFFRKSLHMVRQRLVIFSLRHFLRVRQLSCIKGL